MLARRQLRPGFWLVFWREIDWLRRRPLLLAFITIVPIGLMALLTLIFSAGLATRLPIAVLDLDSSDLSRSIIRMVDATPDTAVSVRVGELAEGRGMILSGKVHGLLMLPRNLERDVFAGRRPEVVFFYNTQTLTIGNLTLRGVSAAVPTAAAGIRLSLRTAQGQPIEEAQAALSPIPVQTHALFNPTLNYVFFSACRDSAECAANRYGDSVGLFGRNRRRNTPPVANSSSAWRRTVACDSGQGAALYDRVSDGARFVGCRAVRHSRVASARPGLAARHRRIAFYSVVPIPRRSACAASQADGERRQHRHAADVAGLRFMGIGFPRLGMNAFAYGFGAILPGTWYLSARIDQTIRGTPLDLSWKPILVLLAFAVGLAGLVALRLESMRAHAARDASGVLPALQEAVP